MAIRISPTTPPKTSTETQPSKQFQKVASSPVAHPRRRKRYDIGYCVLFALPNFALLGLFAYWPVINNAYLSLTDWDLISPSPEFVGLQNYVDLFSSTDFLAILGRTGIFTVVVVSGSLVGGLLFAVLLNQKLRGRTFVRTMIFAPYVLPGAAVATVWLMMFDPNYGLSRVLFEAIGMTSPNWMSSTTWALPGLIIVHLWSKVGFCAIVYISAMQGLPVEQYEAASLDGAGKIRQFWSLTVPFLSPTTFFLLIIQIIGTFQAFDAIAVMTGGGPAGSTTTLSWFVYDEGFRSFNIGFSAAGSMIMFAFLILITVIQSRFLGKKVHYQ